MSGLSGTIFASAAYTATQTSPDLPTRGAKGIRIFIDATVKGGSAPSVVFSVKVKDPASGVYTAVITSAAVTGVSHQELVVYPGVTVASNLAVSAPLGADLFQVVATAGNTDSLTYSVGYALIP